MRSVAATATRRAPPAPPHLALIREAAWDERALDIRHRDKGGAVTARRIWPLSVVFLDRELMCLAWCCLRQDFRRFKMTAMEAVVPTDESFRPRRVALLRGFLEKLREGRNSGPGAA